MKKNKIDRISLAGGLLGMLFTDPRGALDSRVAKANSNGWNLHQVLPHTETNLAVKILSLVVLIVTLGLYTFGAGYILVFEKDAQENAKPEQPSYKGSTETKAEQAPYKDSIETVERNESEPKDLTEQNSSNPEFSDPLARILFVVGLVGLVGIIIFQSQYF